MRQSRLLRYVRNDKIKNAVILSVAKNPVAMLKAYGFFAQIKPRAQNDVN